MAEKTTKTREESTQETLRAVESRYSTDIDLINSKIDYAVSDCMFSVFIDYIPNNDVQIYFRDGFGYTIEPKTQLSSPIEDTNINDRSDSKTQVQGIEISWLKLPSLFTI